MRLGVTQVNSLWRFRVIRTYGRKAAVATAILAVGSAGSAMFAGSALAGGHHETDGDGGDGGNGGKTNVNCVLPIGASLGIIGQGDSVSQCNATGGDGGDAGDGVDY